MSPTAKDPFCFDLAALLRGEADLLLGWLASSDLRWVLSNISIIIAGMGCYGAAMGVWRSPEQALFVAIKLPLIVLLTVLGNAVLNAMLAPLLGLNINLRQSLHAVLVSFTVAGAVLGAFSPLAAFLVWNAPPLIPGAGHSAGYVLVKLAHVLAIAAAGIVGNVRLFQVLLRMANGDRGVAHRVLFAWLGGNLFLGSQLSWILRPFIGAPQLPVEFLRGDLMFRGNFYENVFHTLLEILAND